MPLAGRHPITFNDSALALTVGGDLTWSLANGLSLIAPVRVTKRPQSVSDYAPGTLDVYGGIGLRFNIVKRIS